MKEKKEKRNFEIKRMRILFLEIALFFLVIVFIFPFFINTLFADAGGNVSVSSGVSIGQSNPNINSLDIMGGSITLVPNSTLLVNCSAIIEDFDGDVDLNSVRAEFFDNSISYYGDSDDNNTHYTNNSCNIDTDYGDLYEAKVDCLFYVYYYANPGTWNCTMYVTDFSSYSDLDGNLSIIQELLAFGLPESIDYGVINATYVSSEKEANVANVGNVKVNLSLSGYAQAVGDGYAMACDYGSTRNISIQYEKYNLTESISGDLTLSQFEGNYTNLTSNVVVNEFNLDYRTDEEINDRINTTYWRIYVPTGVAGTCNGTIVFGAIKAVAT